MNNAEQYFTNLGQTQAPESWNPSSAWRKSKRERINTQRKTTYERELAQYNQNQADYRNFLMAQYQFQKNKELSDEAWNRETAYNNPSAQMERLKAAGLNPNLVNPSIDSGNYSTTPYSQSSSSAAATPSGAMPESGPLDDAMQMMGTVQSIMGIMSQGYGLAQQALQNDATKQLISEKAMQNQFTEIDLAKKLVSEGDIKNPNSWYFKKFLDTQWDKLRLDNVNTKLNLNDSFSRWQYLDNSNDYFGSRRYELTEKEYQNQDIQNDSLKQDLKTKQQDYENTQRNNALQKSLDDSLTNLGLPEPLAQIFRHILTNFMGQISLPKSK